MSADTMRAAFLLANHGKEPSDSLLAVLDALQNGEDYTAGIVERSGVERRNATRLLHRLVRMDMAHRRGEGEQDPRHAGPPRVYYRLTPAGALLAEQIMSGAAR